MKENVLMVNVEQSAFSLDLSCNVEGIKSKALVPATIPPHKRNQQKQYKQIVRGKKGDGWTSKEVQLNNSILAQVQDAYLMNISKP